MSCRYYNAEDLNGYIEENLVYPGGDTHTTGGLEMAKSKLFGQPGDRPNIRDVIILLTDGIPTLPEPNPK